MSNIWKGKTTSLLNWTCASVYLLLLWETGQRDSESGLVLVAINTWPIVISLKFKEQKYLSTQQGSLLNTSEALNLEPKEGEGNLIQKQMHHQVVHCNSQVLICLQFIPLQGNRDNIASY